MMTQKMRVIAMDELNQSAREKLMRKNWGNHIPQINFSGMAVAVPFVRYAWDHDVEICARQRAN